MEGGSIMAKNNNNMKAKSKDNSKKDMSNMEIGNDMKSKNKNNSKMDMSNMEVANDMKACRNNNKSK